MMHKCTNGSLTLLKFAAQNSTMCQFLVRNGFDVDEVSGFGYAIRFLEREKLGQHNKTNGHNFSTPLYATITRRAYRTTYIFLEAGAYPTLTGPIGISALHSVLNDETSKVRNTCGFKRVLQSFDKYPGRSYTAPNIQAKLPF
jgi:hypothetical protein